MPSYLFKGVIACQNCGKRFRGKLERNKRVYICSGYHNYGESFCKRFIIHEDELIRIIQTHLKHQNREVEDISAAVQQITVKDQIITIYYTDNTKSVLTDYSINF